MKRLLIPYFSFGFFYVTPIMILCKLTNQNYFEYIFDGIILAKNTRHLWYLLTLFIIFVIVILFQKIIKQYFNIILFILILISLYSYLFPTVFQISNVVHYLFYFVLGILINKKFETIKYLYFKTKRSILFILLIGLYLLYFFDIEMIFSFCLKLYMMILIFSLLIEINVLKNGQYIEKVRNTFFYKTIDKNSFGIYLFHPMIIYICFYIIEETSVNPYLFSFLVFVIGIMLSVILTEIIRKTKLHFCIGE